MPTKLNRRKFLRNAAATAGAAALLPRKGLPLSGDTAAAAEADIATRNLTHAAVAKVKWKSEPFPVTDVRLLPSFWKEMMERNRSYLYSLPNDRLAHNFRVTAGLPSDADPLGGWEDPKGELRGHYVGHYLSACAMLYASTGDEFIRRKADELVSTLAACQAQDGYLSAYPTEFYDRLREHKEVWAPFYTYHKILAGMIDMYEHTGNKQALDVAVKMADWANAYSRTFSPDEWQKVLLVEHGGMMESAFNLYAITGNEKYRDLAYRFEHHKIFDPLAAGEDKLADNHANTNIPKIIGAARGYELTGDERLRTISENFYRYITEHHVYCTGGTSNYEGWRAPDAIASELGPDAEECCCSYNMMKLSRHIFGREPNAAHFDYYERVLFNVRAGTQDPDGMLMYYVSLQPGLYKTFGTPLESFWCCTGTGSEEYTKLNDSIYWHDEDALFVNLYLPSTLDWKERGLRLTQTTKFPNEQRTTFTVDSAPNRATALKLRIPYWATKGVAVAVNGQPVQGETAPSSYVTVSHDWKTGDVITLDLPLTLHVNRAPDDEKVQAAMYGPLVLAVRMGTEDLTKSAINGPEGPARHDRGYPMPAVNLNPPKLMPWEKAPAAAPVDKDAIWFEKVDEGSREYPLMFHTKGQGPIHTLVPLNSIMDERYSVYVRNETV
jgi:uncharacterized protein